jgi:hypothetical protein
MSRAEAEEAEAARSGADVETIRRGMRRAKRN